MFNVSEFNISKVFTCKKIEFVLWAISVITYYKQLHNRQEYLIHFLSNFWWLGVIWQSILNILGHGATWIFFLGIHNGEFCKIVIFIKFSHRVKIEVLQISLLCAIQSTILCWSIFKKTPTSKMYLSWVIELFLYKLLKISICVLFYWNQKDLF